MQLLVNPRDVYDQPLEQLYGDYGYGNYDFDGDNLDNGGVYDLMKGGADEGISDNVQKRRDAFDEVFRPEVQHGEANLLGVTLASALFVAAIAMLALLVLRHRRSNSTKGSAGGVVDDSSQLKQFVLPQQVKPVVSYKTAAGPSGLKNSPSPIQSPETSQPPRAGQHLGDNLSRSATPNLQMSPIEEPGRSANTSLEVMDAVSTTTVDTTDSDTASWHSKGTVHLTLRYAPDKEALVVSVTKAEGLKCPPNVVNSPKGSDKDANEVHTMDPYVKLQLLPEKQHKAKTRVVRNTCDPIYDEEFTFFGLTSAQLQSSTLHLAVVAFDRFSRDEIVGEAITALHELEEKLKQKDNTVPVQMELHSRASKYCTDESRGELLVSLCHQPSSGTVTAVVLKAKNLPKFDVSGMADPYVKIHMLYGGQRVAKKKTHVKKRTLAPVYNESFVFDLPANDENAHNQVTFEFTVMDWDRVTKNEVMGRCTLGAGAREESGTKHWNEVLQQPRRQIAQWHRLRP